MDAKNSGRPGSDDQKAREENLPRKQKNATETISREGTILDTENSRLGNEQLQLIKSKSVLKPVHTIPRVPLQKQLP